MPNSAGGRFWPNPTTRDHIMRLKKKRQTPVYEQYPKELSLSTGIDHLSLKGAGAIAAYVQAIVCAQIGKQNPGFEMKDDNVNDTRNFVSSRIRDWIQKALDAIYKIGKKVFAPREMDVKDDQSTAMKLFQLIRTVADKTLSELWQREELHKSPSEQDSDDMENGQTNGVEYRHWTAPHVGSSHRNQESRRKPTKL